MLHLHFWRLGRDGWKAEVSWNSSALRYPLQPGCFRVVGLTVQWLSAPIPSFSRDRK